MNLGLKHKTLVLVSVPLIYTCFLASIVVFLFNSHSSIDSNQSSNAQTESLSAAKNYILIGLAINGVMSICLALFFARALEKAIKTIQNNLKKIESCEDLSPPIERKDELGDLDASVHHLASVLREKSKAN
jgi:methyl-accepting chemotaxis protein